MFKFKRKKKVYKLAKAEQKEIIKNSIEEAAAYKHIMEKYHKISNKQLELVH